MSVILILSYVALHLLRQLGWVHHDVSIGNLLSSQVGVKLANLGYAKKTLADTTHHGMRAVSNSFVMFS
jgi:hypothetical protein